MLRSKGLAKHKPEDLVYFWFIQASIDCQTFPSHLYCAAAEIHTKQLLTGFVAATIFGHFSVTLSDTKNRETG